MSVYQKPELIALNKAKVEGLEWCALTGSGNSGLGCKKGSSATGWYGCQDGSSATVDCFMGNGFPQ